MNWLINNYTQISIIKLIMCKPNMHPHLNDWRHLSSTDNIVNHLTETATVFSCSEPVKRGHTILAFYSLHRTTLTFQKALLNNNCLPVWEADYVWYRPQFYWGLPEGSLRTWVGSQPLFLQSRHPERQQHSSAEREENEGAFEQQEPSSGTRDFWGKGMECGF